MCSGGAGTDDASEIAWIYGPAAQACYWLSEKGPPHDVGPFYRQAANLNVFAKIEREDGFYKESARLQRYGQQRIFVTKIPTLTAIATPCTKATMTTHVSSHIKNDGADGGDKYMLQIVEQKLPSASATARRTILKRIVALTNNHGCTNPSPAAKLGSEWSYWSKKDDELAVSMLESSAFEERSREISLSSPVANLSF